MQIGIDSFAAAFDDAGLAASPAVRLGELLERIERADQVGLDVSASASTTAASSSTLPRPSSWPPRQHAPSTSA